MTVFQLEDSITEFVKANTSDFRFASNDETVDLSEPRVWSGFVPRDEVGAIVPGDISTYPAIVVNAQSGEMAIDQEVAEISIIVCCFDKNHDQQGYRDCVNVVQRLKDRFREIDIIQERFIWTPPLSWAINRKLGSGMNAFPYFFADMTAHFLLPVMMTQYDVTAVDGDVTPGRYNSVPIPTPAPNEHWKHEVPPTIEWDEHYAFQSIPEPIGPCVITSTPPKPQRPPKPKPPVEPVEPPIGDPDAEAFFVRAGIIDPTQQDAIEGLVVALKGANIWVKMRVLYPFVGGTAATHKHNLKSSSYQITWGNGVTHSANGYRAAQGIFYVDDNWSHTGFNLLANMTPESLAFGCYNRTGVETQTIDMVADPAMLAATNYGIVSVWRNCVDDQSNWGGPTADNGSKGFWINTRSSSSSLKLFQNASQRGTIFTGPQGALPDAEMMLDKSYGDYPMQERALAFISDGLTDAEVASFNTAVQAFQTVLGRNV